MSSNQSTTAPLQKEAAGKLIGKFNRSPIVFDEACGLPPHIQMGFRRLSSLLWCDGARIWEGSYQKLAELCRIAVSYAHAMVKELVKAGLIICHCRATGKSTGNTGTLQIQLSTDRLWQLNARYCQLTGQEREDVRQECAWKTLRELDVHLSFKEWSRPLDLSLKECYLSLKECYLSFKEWYLSLKECSQAQDLSLKECYLSPKECSDPLSDSPEAGADVPADVITDTDITTTDVDADSNAPANHNGTASQNFYQQGYGGVPSLTSEGQRFYDLYCQQKHVKIHPEINERSAPAFNQIGESLEEFERLKVNLSELLPLLHAEARLHLPPNAKDPSIKLGNLRNAVNPLLEKLQQAEQASVVPPPQSAPTKQTACLTQAEADELVLVALEEGRAAGHHFEAVAVESKATPGRWVMKVTWLSESGEPLIPSVIKTREQWDQKFVQALDIVEMKRKARENGKAKRFISSAKNNARD